MPIHGDQSEVFNAVIAPDNYLAYQGQTMNNSATPPQLTGPAVIEGTPINRFLIDVANQSIYWQLKHAAAPGPGGGQGVWDSVETYMLPGSRVITRVGVIGIRVRAAIPASALPPQALQAIVTVEAVK